MPARSPTLGTASDPFGVSNYAFGAFNLGTGTDPVQQALTDAANTRYDVSVRYGNGTATTEEYLAAIAAERAISTQMLGSQEEAVRTSAQKHIVELDNLTHDVSNHSAEVVANAVDDHGEALLAVYQNELATMTAGSTGYVEKQAQITSLQKSITTTTQADNSRTAAYELATAHNAWTDGQLSDDDYKAAYQKYADAQTPGTAEWTNAHQAVDDLTYSINRDVLVNAVNDHSKTMADLLTFDKARLDSQSADKNSDGYRQSLSTYQTTQQQAFAIDQQKTDQAYQNQQMTSAQALDWYKQQLVGKYSDNPNIVDAINGRIATLNTNVQSDRDTAAINSFNKGTMTPQDFLAYAKTRAAAYPVGTSDHNDWLDREASAKTAAVQPALTHSYSLSQQYLQLQKFISDNSAPPAGGGTTTKIILGADGKGHVVTSATAPTPAEQAAYQQRQAEVADAKVQLAQLGAEIATTPNGFVSSQQMLSYWQGEQAKVAKGSSEWYTFQGQIDGVNSNIHTEAVMAAGGIKVSYPELTKSGGTSAKAPATSISSSGAVNTAGLPTTTTPAVKGTSKAPAVRAGSGPGGLGGGNYSAAELDYTANELSRLTGLSPAVTRLWVQKEEGGGNNPLGVSGTGTAGSSGIRANFTTLDQGIQAAATWINTHSNMAGIKASVGKSDAVQIAAIDSSPWGPHGNNGGYQGSLVDLARTNGLTVPKGATGAAPAGGGAAVTVGGKGAAAPKTVATKPTNIDGKMTVDDFMRGLGQQSSKGDYAAKNTATGAFGKYQILPGNWTSWASKYLGDASAPPTPENQDKVAKAELNALHSWLGSWQAVAHYWLTGSSDAAAHQDPAKWGATDTAFVTGVLHGAGGALVGTTPRAPSAPTAGGSSARYVVPTTPISSQVGVRSGLQAIVPGTQSKDAKSGLTTQKTVGINFPPGMTIGAFDNLYTAIHAALDKGAVSYTYVDGNGHSINILLPDNPQGRAALVTDLDNRHIQLTGLAASAYAGTPQASAASNAYKAAVTTAGQNAVKLLDTEYGGKYPKGSDMEGISRGLGAAPVVTIKGKANPMVAANIKAGTATAAGRTEALTEGQYTGIQTNSLNPIAAGARVTDIAKNYIASETAAAQDDWAHARTDDALGHLQNIQDATGQFGTITKQIDVYSQQGKAGAAAINRATGAETPAAVAADQARIAPGGEPSNPRLPDELNTAKAPANKLAGDMLGFIKTDAAGNIVRDGATGKVVMKGDSIWLASQGANGDINFTRAAMPPGSYSDSQTANPKTPVPGITDAKLVRITVPSQAGSHELIPDAYSKYHVGTIGYFTNADGNRVPVQGRILDIVNPDGGLIVENPFQQGKWAPGPIFFSSNPGTTVSLVPAVDNKGKPLASAASAIQFKGPDGNTYKMVTDPKTGQLNLYGESPDPKGNAINFGQVNQGNGGRIVQAAGVGSLDLGRNSMSTVGFLTTSNVGSVGNGINGPWVGISLDDAYRTAFGPRAALYGQQQVSQLAGLASKLVTDPAGQITKWLNGIGAGTGGTPVKPADTGVGGLLGAAYGILDTPARLLGGVTWPWGTPVNAGIAAPPPAPTGDVRAFIGPSAPPPATTWDHGTALSGTALPPIAPPVAANPSLPRGTADAQVQFNPVAGGTMTNPKLPANTADAQGRYPTTTAAPVKSGSAVTIGPTNPKLPAGSADTQTRYATPPPAPPKPVTNPKLPANTADAQVKYATPAPLPAIKPPAKVNPQQTRNY